jgi:cyclopropane fatty-acyl-phospholipid synthase-like methyltransferase
VRVVFGRPCPFCAILQLATYSPKLEPLGFNDRFRRMWEYYLAYCEVGFRAGSINVEFFKLAG